MAVKWPAANGNWSNAANWNGGTKPVSGDTVHADGKTVTIDEDFNLGAGSKLTTEARSGGTAGGGFTFSADLTLTVADLIGNVTGGSCLTYTGSGDATINANSIVATRVVIRHSGTGTLNVTGTFRIASTSKIENAAAGTLNIIGYMSTISHSDVCQNQSIGTINFLGDCGQESASNGSGINNVSTGSVHITGNPFCSGPFAGARNSSAGLLTITGNPSATSSGGGARNYSTGTMTITTVGTLSGNNSVITGSGTNIINASTGTVTVTGNLTGSSLTPRGIVLHNFADGAVTVNGTLASGDLSEGQYANRLGACALRNESPTVAAQVTTFADVGAIQGRFNATTYPEILTLTYDGGMSEVEYILDDPNNSEIPAEADVRFGTEYALSRTGTCHVPPAESVALNVPVDDTVGTYEGGGGGLSPELIERLEQCATVASTGAQIAAMGVCVQ
jgi:hypothetical protein